MFATVSELGASTWDALHIWHAPALLGPWTQVSLDPVLIDAQCARPAGPMFERADGLLRPAQNCSESYGDKLALCRVTRLDKTEGFEQQVVNTLEPGAGWSEPASTRSAGPEHRGDRRAWGLSAGLNPLPERYARADHVRTCPGSPRHNRQDRLRPAAQSLVRTHPE